MRGHLIVDVPLAVLGIALYPSCAFAPVVWLGAASLAIHTLALIHPRTSIYLPVWWQVPGATNCALTYDDGPNPEVTPRLLDLLGAAKQQATFFLIGEHVRRHPLLTRRIAAEGHAIGLHSDNHSRWFNCWRTGKVQIDLEACGKSIEDAASIEAPRLFRPPVGLKNPLVAQACARMGLRMVTWTARALDGSATPTPDVAFRRLLPGIRAGGICVMHDGHEPTRPAVRATCLDTTRLVLERLDRIGLRSRKLRRIPDGVAIGDTNAEPG
jgi:peptidoglycan/xylan/chitin deacetylase (PgdA/CDA1 family)